MITKKVIAAMLALALSSFGLENGVGRTPPMGWNPWNGFRVNITTAIFKEMTDSIVSKGLKAAGYQYVNVDDGWASTRTNGVVVPNSSRHPQGMKYLADYIKSKGLKPGIYTDAGTMDCGYYWDNERPGDWGAYGHYTQDMDLFINQWGYEYIKVDYCGAINLGLNTQTQYTQLRDAIVATGKPVFYNVCRWVFPGSWVVDVGNSWRIGNDIYQGNGTVPVFTGTGGFSVTELIDSVYKYREYNGPGHWNDADMLAVGFGMTPDEDKSHFSMWCMLATSLLVGNDVRTMSEATRQILINTDMIAVNQDSLGICADRIRKNGDQELWWKPMKDSSRVICLFNRGSSSATMSFTKAEAKLSGGSTVATMRDLWQHSNIGPLGDSYSTTVPAHGVVVLRLYSGPDVAPPTITGASTPNGTSQVVVAFSEPIEQASAQNKANYSINNGITISSATLGADLTTVTLNVSAISQDVTYTLTVNNVRDRAATPNTIIANSTTTFRYTNSVTRIRFYPRATFAARMQNGKFEGTNGDPATGPYTTLYTIQNIPTEGAWTDVTSFTIADPGFRYIRYMSPTHSSGNVAEIEFYRGSTKATGTIFGTPGSYQNSGNDYTKVFDGNTSTFMDYSTDTGGYVGMDMSTATLLNPKRLTGTTRSTLARATEIRIFDCNGKLVSVANTSEISNLQQTLKAHFGTGVYILSINAKGTVLQQAHIIVQ